MGKAILYCSRCSSILREDDFAKGKAVRLGDRVFCAGCAPEAAPVLRDPPSQKNISSSRMAANRPVSPQAIRPSAADSAAGGRKALFLGGSAAAVLVLAVLATVALRESPPVTGARRAAPPEEAAPGPVPASRDRAALDAARRWAKANPQDLAGQIREFQNIVFDWEKTPSAAEAQKEVARLKAEVRGRVDQQLATLEAEIKASVDRRDYAAALKVIEGAGKRLPYAEWELARSKREYEIRELLFRQPAPPPPGPDGLVGHWTFDEGAGSEAKDASGKGHTGRLMSGAAWAPGRIGGGVRCDGKGAHVQLPNSAILDTLQAGDFTLAAWFKPEAVPPGKGAENTAAYGIVLKAGFHEGLMFNGESKFQVEHWLADNSHPASGSWNEPSAPGTFHHVTGVVDRTRGKIQTWLNGELKHEGSWTPGSAAWDYGSGLWRIGIGAPDATTYAWPANGVIDDVRMYQRALTAPEIKSLVDLAR